ncbi:MAG: ATP-binding cassette domain-containing protein [Bacteroidia bacterium]|nr:ATP-binding cassette domain-containing protein [Bacteroidia bacterium]
MSKLKIKAENVSKKYTLYAGKRRFVPDFLSSLSKNRDRAPTLDNIWALKNISFELREGEVLGIIGKNGAGKSTLLKILSQITPPTKGRIEIYGHTATLLEVGAGFHPELSGRENVYLNGILLGMKRQEIHQN